MKYRIQINEVNDENRYTVPLYEQIVEDLDIRAVIAVGNKLHSYLYRAEKSDAIFSKKVECPTTDELRERVKECFAPPFTEEEMKKIFEKSIQDPLPHLCNPINPTDPKIWKK